MTCCKEKAVFVAVYEEKPRKRSVRTSNNGTIKHHHHHHLHIRHSKNCEGSNRRAELLSYSQHLRESSKSGPPSNSLLHPKPLVVSTTKDGETMAPVLPIPKKQKVKKHSSCLNSGKISKCFAISYSKRRVKQKKAKSSKSSAKKANAIMKTFNARTHKGARRFWSKLMATIQRYR